MAFPSAPRLAAGPRPERAGSPTGIALLALGCVLAAAPGCATGAGTAALLRSATKAEPPYRVLGPAAPTLDASSVLEERAVQAVASGEARCPADMSLVDDRLCVDRWEATVLVRRGAREEVHTPFEPLDDVGAPYRAVSRPSVTPQGYVSGAQANVACRASGKRLCTAGEWERACRGPRRTQYPYGQDRRTGACNDDVRATHPVVEAAHRLGVPADATWTTGMNLPLVNQLPGGLAKTGERSACETPEGIYDLVGNLHEWVADADGTFRGGFYMDTTQNGEGCAYQTTAHDFGYHDYSTGFRCCANADAIE